MVMVFHYHVPLGGVGWAGGFLDKVAGAGSAGVNLFFVLSGFLITGILWDAKRDARYFRNFYARRVLRIFPLYYGALFVGLVLVPWLHPIANSKYVSTVENQIWLWTYTSNFYESWVGRAMPLYGHFWSLAVEEQFYLIWPFVVLWSERRALIVICGVCFIGAFIVRLALLNAGANPALAVLRLTPCQMDSLATGALLALAWRTRNQAHAELWRVMARKIFVVSTGVIVALVVAFPILVGTRHLPLSLCYSCWNVFFASGLYTAITAPTGNWYRSLLEMPALRIFGKYSYGLYVFHWPMGRLWLSVMEKWQAKHLGTVLDHAIVFQVGYFLMAAGSSFLVASLSWHLYEKQFLRLKRHFEYERRHLKPVDVALLSGAV